MLKAKAILIRHVGLFSSCIDPCTNPSALWSFIDYKKKNNVLPSSMVFGDAHGSGNAQICKLFSDYFKSVY
jgi:hypothetical protein